MRDDGSLRQPKRIDEFTQNCLAIRVARRLELQPQAPGTLPCSIGPGTRWKDSGTESLNGEIIHSPQEAQVVIQIRSSEQDKFLSSVSPERVAGVDDQTRGVEHLGVIEG